MSPEQRQRLATARLWVFDLDGTLIDSLPAIAESLNEVRRAHGLPPRDLECVRRGIGAGARVLLERTTGDGLRAGLDLEELYEELLAAYRRRAAAGSPFFTGAEQFLDFVARRAKLAVLTNKPREVTRLTLAALGAESRFVAVMSPEDAPERKPSPLGLSAILARLRIPPSAAVLVGDAAPDFEAGRGAGVFTVGMTHGYGGEGAERAAPDVWVPSFAALRDLLEEGGRACSPSR